MTQQLQLQLQQQPLLFFAGDIWPSKGFDTILSFILLSSLARSAIRLIAG